MSKNALFVIVLLILIGGGYYWYSLKTPESSIVISQNSTNSGENPLPGSQVHDLPVEPAAAVARKDLAAKIGVDEKSIVILQISETEWSDGCLGLGQANESCLMAIVPGFKVELTANGKNYIYRTDKSGSSVRMETK